MAKDEICLRIISLLHYLVGGLALFFVSMPLILLAAGVVDIVSSESILKVIVISSESMAGKGDNLSPRYLVSIVLAVAVIFYLMVLGISVGMVVSARFLAVRKYYRFSIVVGCMESLLVPFGTILGVFTVIVLSRDSVRGLYSGIPKEGLGGPAE